MSKAHSVRKAPSVNACLATVFISVLWSRVIFPNEGAPSYNYLTLPAEVLDVTACEAKALMDLNRHERELALLLSIRSRRVNEPTKQLYATISMPYKSRNLYCLSCPSTIPINHIHRTA